MSRVIQDTSFDSVWLYLKEIFFKILVFQPALVLELSCLSVHIAAFYKQIGLQKQASKSKESIQFLGGQTMGAK